MCMHILQGAGDSHAASEGVGLKREQFTTSMPMFEGFSPVLFSTSATAPNITISASLRALAMLICGGVTRTAADTMPDESSWQGWFQKAPLPIHAGGGMCVSSQIQVCWAGMHCRPSQVAFGAELQLTCWQVRLLTET
jgi:hypothetical protein